MSMTLPEMLDAMILLATQRHAGTFDKSGMPYILHPLKVMHYLKTDDIEEMIIAVGHDLLEDTYKKPDGTPDIEAGLADLRARGFTERVVLGIYSVTRLPGETEEEYQVRVIANRDGRKVKKGDLRHNSDIRRLKHKGIREKDVRRTVRYHAFYQRIEEAEKASR